MLFWLSDTSCITAELVLTLRHQTVSGPAFERDTEQRVEVWPSPGREDKSTPPTLLIFIVALSRS